MRCSGSLLFSAMLLLTLVLFCGMTAYSQDPPNVAMGISPSATYHGGDFDFVDMATGRLNLRIPLVIDHSQRGKLNFTNSVTYTSTGAWVEWEHGVRGQFFNIEPPKYGPSSPAIVTEGALSGVISQSYTDDATSFSAMAWWVPEGGYGIGPMHPMGTLSGDTQTGVQTMESIDGSGIRLFMGYVNNNYTRTVTNKEGIQFGGVLEDANGNEMTGSGSYPINTTMDSLGRAWTTTQNSSDVTGCPTGGPVAPTISMNWTIPGPANTVRIFKFCYSTINIHTSFNDPGYQEYIGNPGMMTGIVLPDGTTWRFDYDNNSISYGDLMAVYPPTGGHISYTWTTLGDGCTTYGFGIRTVASRTTFDGTNSSIWRYNWANGGFTVTDPLGSDTVYTGGPCSGVVTQIKSYSGLAATGTLLKTVNKTYRDLPNPYLCDVSSDGADAQLLSGITTLWPNGQQSQVQLTYDSGFTFTDSNSYHSFCDPTTTYTSSYGLVTSETHSDYGNGSPGPLLSTTTTNYLALSNSNYLTANLLDLPSSVITTDTSGNKCAETNYTYDDVGRLFTYTGTLTQHVAAPSSVRGNLTSTTQKLSSTPCQPSASWTSLPPSYRNVYDTGMPYQSIDPLNHTTTFSYQPVSPCTVSTYYGAFVTQTTFPSTSSPNPASHVISGCYDFNTGSLTSFTDQNSQTTTYTYDAMLRPTNVTYPSTDGGQTNFYYPNTTTVEMKKQIDATRWTDSFTYSDGLGRESRSMSVNDESSPYDQMDTCYDAVGRVGFKSYPYQGPGTSAPIACSNSVKPGDSFTYDPLNRVTQVMHSDNSTVLTSYTPRATSVSDEGNGTQRVQRISQVDGLGRLASLCEVGSVTQLGTGGAPAACGQDIAGTGFLTTYGYDGLSNLTSVSQGGYLPRTFAYDSLSRLLTGANPESGTITYGYDNASRLTTRTAPKPSQTSSSVTVTTTMGYDEINRLRTNTYANSDNSTTFLAPSVTLNYDQTSALGVSGLNYTIGRESSAVVAGSQAGEVFGYDKLGRVKINSQCTPQNCSAGTVFPISYNVDLLGDMISGTNGMGVTLNYTVNHALRLTGTTSSLSDSNHPGTLYSSPHYNGAGSILSATIGNPGSSVSETRSYDGRLRLTNITDGSLYNVTIPTNGYAPNSDILLANDSVNGNWTYGYDAFNRLTSASTTGQSYTYDYDRFGNRWHQNGPHASSLSFSGNNNRMDTYSYDAAGNVLNDGTTTYTYDSESRIISATNSTSGTSTYLYDADGRRIRKTTTAGGTVDFLYDLGGHEMTQLTSAGAWNRGEVYAGGRHLVTYSGGTGGTTVFNFSDWLGTERARSSPGATTACETITSLPFGDALTTTGSCGDPSPMHFTGKERDSESGLDNFGARYDSSQYGRFMSPDPSHAFLIRQVNPQRWNQYSYSINNPITYSDPDGRDAIAVNFAGEVPVGGHEGIIVVHADGQATYARFGPVHGDKPFDQGQVSVKEMKTSVKFGPNGLPTDASYKELADEAGKAEGQPASTVGFNYFKTSEAESIMLSNWIKQFNEKNTPDYAVNGTNCAAFCIAGLLKANAIKNENISLIPDRLFQLLASRANQNYTWQGTTPQKEIVTHCIRHEDGSCQ